MSEVVAVIPPGSPIDASVQAMHAMEALYPNQTLTVTNDSVTGGLLILRATGPTTAPVAPAAAGTGTKPAKSTGKKASKGASKKAALKADPAPTPTTNADASITLGVGTPGDDNALVLAFAADSSGIPVIADWAKAMLDEHEASNYLTFTMADAHGDRYAFTIQRCTGFTPAEHIAVLQKEIAALTAPTSKDKSR